MKVKAFFLLIYLIGSQNTFSQDFFEKVSGHIWEGKGELLGSKASFKMEWMPVLNGKFYQLSFQNQRDDSKDYIFKAIAFYTVKDDSEINGTWYDSRGYSFPLRGHLEENKLLVFWGSPEYEEGKTVYSLEADGHIQVQDYYLKNGEYFNFGNANYQGIN